MKAGKNSKKGVRKGRYSLAVRIVALACAVLIVISAFAFLFFAG